MLVVGAGQAGLAVGHHLNQTVGRFLLVDAAAEVGAVQLLGGELRLFRRAHGDERETAGAAGHLVHGDIGVGNGTELLEVRTEFALGGVERQVSNV